MPSVPISSLARVAQAARTFGISIIIPAHNAEMTLAATLNSVLGQTHTVWEAVIVDDGSTDGTNTTAEDWAHRDRRFRALHQQQCGVSAARNSGLQVAQYPFVLFLDSDDRIAPTHLECMAAMLLADDTLDAVHCGWRRVLPSGVLGPARLGSDHRDLFEYFAFQCFFPIHACVLRRELALAVGGFDASLTTCEDWDFFQRVARAGARFGRVPEVLALYQVRANSASLDSQRCLTDARRVLTRGHGRDPRMWSIAQAHPDGRNPAYLNAALYYTVTYLAAQEIGEGRDGLDLLDGDFFTPAPDLLPETVADVIQEHFAADRSVQDWAALWGQVNAALAAFLIRLEAQTRGPALAFTTLRHLEQKIVLIEPNDASLLLASTYRVCLDLASPIPDVFLPPEADRLICRLTLKGEPIGAVELPGTDVVAGRQIAKAILQGRRRLVLLLLLRSPLTPGRALRFGLATVHDLVQHRTLQLLYNILTAKPKDRLIAARRVTHEIASVLRAHLSLFLSERPSLASIRVGRRWQKFLDTAAASGRAHAREQIYIRRAKELDHVVALTTSTGRIASAKVPARRPGRPTSRLAGECACSIPILMYHRIATNGSAAMEQFRVAPDLFANQMATLRRAGYYTVGLGDWVSAMAGYQSLRGRPVILTFDDGYQDFLTAAMPVLRVHSFSATVFLVAERIGRNADWDSRYGQPAPLLLWEEVRALQEAGIEFGCHSSAHRLMTGMRRPELAEDTVRARAILEEGLRTSVKSLAYPYGAENQFVRDVIEDLGFQAAVTCEPGLSRLGDDPLRLPRVEVTGSSSPESLLALIDHASPGAKR
jgi:peptidoglycan/xylan/chitin deacetylase (PgdA/CDA1 family)/GT2 family glycosyltransferase